MIIHKYKVDRGTRQFDENGQFTILSPRIEKVLSIAFQGNQLTVWVLVDLDGPTTETKLQIIPTGGEIEAGTFIQTFFEGPFVWHLFQV